MRSLTPGLDGVHSTRDGFGSADIAIADGKIAAIAPRGARPPPAQPIDLAGRIVLPCFVDCHTHIDKGHIWPRKPNPDGTFMGALDAAGDGPRARAGTPSDVARRMDFSLRSAYAHGTKALRTHLDSVAPQETISWPVFEEMRESWRGRIELQAACLTGIEAVRDKAWFAALAKRVAAARGVLGAVTYMVPDLEELLDRVFRAGDRARARPRFPRRRDRRHVGAISLQEDRRGRPVERFRGQNPRRPLLLAVAPAGPRGARDAGQGGEGRASPSCRCRCAISICRTAAMTRTTPRWRGVTLLHEMKARGIPVAVASDNTRDPFYAYGDLDMLEVYRMATRILHFDHPVGDWPKAVAATPAEIMRLDGAGVLAAGGPADFVIFKGRSWTELLSRPESDRIVVRDGKAIERDLPDYAELDDLMGD